MKAVQEAIRMGTLLTLFAICGAANAQAPHSVTYTQVSVAPGTQINIGGTQFVAVQVPVRQFTMDKRYAVRFLAPLFQDSSGDFVSGTIFTEHSNESLENPNATIDGIPARIEIDDGRTYGVSTGIDPQTFESTNFLQVSSYATAVVYMKLGDTLLVYTCRLTKSDHEVALGPDEYRGTAQAAYGRYTDPVSLIGQSNGLDKCIDYFRVIALN